jgi:dienelactone hydrolase
MTTSARVLICNGAADSFVPDADIAAFTRSLNEHGVDAQFINYSGAVHAFTNPGADELARITGIKGIGYNAPADRRSWGAMKMFFEEGFSKVE